MRAANASFAHSPRRPRPSGACPSNWKIPYLIVHHGRKLAVPWRRGIKTIEPASWESSAARLQTLPANSALASNAEQRSHAADGLNEPGAVPSPALIPAHPLKMVMERRHQKHAPVQLGDREDLVADEHLDPEQEPHHRGHRSRVEPARAPPRKPPILKNMKPAVMKNSMDTVVTLNSDADQSKAVREIIAHLPPGRRGHPLC